jgi:hypothetical protein
MKAKPTHGGKRKGAGRPKKEPTKILRVPASIIPKVKKLIHDHIQNQK